MAQIYILELQNNYYYVGKSDNTSTRIAGHKEGNGAQWTKLHKYIRTIEIINSESDFDEIKYTLIYMKKYGIDRVRGDIFCAVILPQDQIKILKDMMASADNLCYKCGQRGHFVADCNNIMEQKKFWESLITLLFRIFGKNSICERCGRDSHTINECFASTDIYGNYLQCERCGRNSHNIINCYARTRIDGTFL